LKNEDIIEKEFQKTRKLSIEELKIYLDILQANF